MTSSLSHHTSAPAERVRRTCAARQLASLALLGTALLLASCGSASQTEATAFAFSGAANLELRGDLTLDAPVTAALEHGERVEILERRRRFVKVRAASGGEGWVDSSVLMTRAELNSMQRLAEAAHERLPQGVATVLDTLNVHTGPYRNAPTFMQVQEGDQLKVVGHRVTLRSSGQKPPAKTMPADDKDPHPDLAEDEDESLPPFMPRAPRLPHNWEALSHPRLSELPGHGNGSPHSAADDWLLVETPTGQAGWVLLRMVFMMVPDEVGQYAEGNFVMSYFPLSEVYDAELGEMKTNWLWATSSRGLQSHDFDSFRVFMYSTRRHRYETAYLERNLKGYYPIEPVTLPDSGDPAFSVISEDETGELVKKTYAFSGTRVRRLTTEPYQAPAPVPEVLLSDTFDVARIPAAEQGWTERLRNAAKGWFSTD